MSGIIGGAGSKSGIIGNTELDYEEGTFTPTVSSGTHSGLNAAGTYTKIGRICFVVIRLGDVNASSGNAYSASSSQFIGGLPFTSSNTHGSPAGGLTTVYDIRISWPEAGNQLKWRIDANNDYAIGHWFGPNNSSGVGSNTIQSEWTTSGASIYLTGSYLV